MRPGTPAGQSNDTTNDESPETKERAARLFKEANDEILQRSTTSEPKPATAPQPPQSPHIIVMVDASYDTKLYTTICGALFSAIKKEKYYSENDYLSFYFYVTEERNYKPMYVMRTITDCVNTLSAETHTTSPQTERARILLFKNHSKTVSKQDHYEIERALGNPTSPLDISSFALHKSPLSLAEEIQTAVAPPPAPHSFAARPQTPRTPLSASGTQTRSEESPTQPEPPTQTLSYFTGVKINRLGKITKLISRIEALKSSAAYSTLDEKHRHKLEVLNLLLGYLNFLVDLDTKTKNGTAFDQREKSHFYLHENAFFRALDTSKKQYDKWNSGLFSKTKKIHDDVMRLNIRIVPEDIKPQ